MRRNKPVAESEGPDRAEILKQISLNIAFEQMILSVLTGAVIGGALAFLIATVELFSNGAFSVFNLLSVFLKGLTASFLIFLAGFFFSVVVLTPLFWAMEKAKRRTVWPYLGASVGVALLVFMLATGETPFTVKNPFEALAMSIIPAVVIALIFGRRMAPYWRAALAADAEMEKRAVFRIH